MLGGGQMCHWVQKRQVSLTCTLNYLLFSLTFCWLPSVLLPVFLECLTWIKNVIQLHQYCQQTAQVVKHSLYREEATEILCFRACHCNHFNHRYKDESYIKTWNLPANSELWPCRPQIYTGLMANILIVMTMRCSTLLFNAWQDLLNFCNKILIFPIVCAALALLFLFTLSDITWLLFKLTSMQNISI